MSKFWETCKEDDPMEEDVDMCSLPKFTKSTLFSSLLSLNDESIIDMLLKCEDNSLDKFVEERESNGMLYSRIIITNTGYPKRTKRNIGNQGPLPCISCFLGLYRCIVSMGSLPRL